MKKGFSRSTLLQITRYAMNPNGWKRTYTNNIECERIVNVCHVFFFIIMIFLSWYIYDYIQLCRVGQQTFIRVVFITRAAQ